MLSQDLSGWGLPSEPSVTTLLLPLLVFPEALSQRACWLEWDGESPILTRLAWVCSVPCLTFVWVLLLNRTCLLGRGSCGG